MGKTTTIKIIRTSIHTFLQNYNYFTIASLLAIPFSASTLFSSSSLSPDSISLQRTLDSRLRSLFDAAGFPVSSELFSIFNLKLSQTITSSILLLPFTFSSLLLTKSSIIQSLNTHHHNSKPPPSFVGIFNSVLRTQLWNAFLIVSANATAFWVLFLAFNCFESFFGVLPDSAPFLLPSVAGGIAYSVVVANATIVCDMALVVAGMESKGGFFSILKACVMIRRRTPTALSLALFGNTVLAGIEALFQFRVANSGNSTPSMVFEGLFIAYLYSMIITIDTITGVVFYKTCKLEDLKDVVDHEKGRRNGY